jgi:WD40 repeat protein
MNMRFAVSSFWAVCLLLLAASAQAQSVKPYLRIETGAHAARVLRIDIDAAERFLVSASDDKTARVWDLRTGRLLEILRPPVGDGNEGKLYAVASSPDGATMAVGGFTGPAGSANFPIYIFDRDSGAIRRWIPGLPEVTNHLAYSKDGRYLAAALGGRDGIRIFEAAGYSEVARDVEYGDNCYGLEFDQSGRLVTASYDGFVRLYSPDFHLLRKERPPDGRQPNSARFSPDGQLIAVGFGDSTTVDVVSAEDLSFQYKPQPSLSGGNLATALWSEGGRALCAAGRYETANSVHSVLCWSDRGKGGLSTFPAAGNTIMDVRALHDGAIAFCDADGTVGVLGPSGVPQWRAAPDLLDYRGGPSFPRLSSDGDNVEVASSYFNGTIWTRHNVSFSVSDQTLQIDTESKSPLAVPATTGLAIDRWKNDEHPTLDGHALPLKAHEPSRSLAISPNRDIFVLGADWHLRKFDRQGKQIWSTSAPGVAWGVNISADGRFVVTALGDGTVRWYTFDKGEEVLALFVDRDLRRWVAWNPDGFFTFQGGGDALIGYQINRGPDREGEFVKVDRLRETFYRPDLIAQILKPGGTQAVLAASNRIGDISNVLSGGLPPEIELISRAQSTETGDYLLQFRIKDMGGGHGRIVYRIDGAEIEGRAVDIAGTGGDTINRYIPVASGTHMLTVTAYNANGKVEGQPKTVQITRSLPALGSNLYVIAAGISHYSDHSLWEGVKFASADADQVAAQFKEQEGKGLYRKVNAISLPDSQATIKNIQGTVGQAAKTVQPGDTFVLYLAGHGEAVDGEYYFIPYEAEYTNQKELLSKSLNREAIQALLKQIPTNKSVLILDTCGAGAFLEGRAIGDKAAIEKIALMSGRVVLAASSSQEMAMDGYRNHGVFTYALLEGLQQAESNAQGEILISRLAEFVQSRVPAITEEKWHYKQLPLSKIEGEPFPIAHKPAN